MGKLRGLLLQHTPMLAFIYCKRASVMRESGAGMCSGQRRLEGVAKARSLCNPSKSTERVREGSGKLNTWQWRRRVSGL